jgi:hypothetical protein
MGDRTEPCGTPAFIQLLNYCVGTEQCGRMLSAEVRDYSYFTTDGQSVSQSVSMSWYREPLWCLRSDITSCPNAAV